MFFGKKKLIFIIGVLFLFSLAACAKGEGPSMDTGASSNKPAPPSMVEKEEPPTEYNGSGEVNTSKEYNNYAEAYLDVLTKNSKGIHSPQGDGFCNSEIAILDVFGDEMPELLYIYRHDYDISLPFREPDVVDAYSLKIFSYNKTEGAQSVFDSIVRVAAGGPNNYCVYLTREGELMLYLSTYSDGINSWGFWKITPNQSIEIKVNNWSRDSSRDLAKLFYYSDEIEKFQEKNYKPVYKENGEEISKEQYDMAAKETMGDIDRVLFQADYDGAGLYEDDDLWKDITPFASENMTCDEAIAWLEAQIGDQ